MLFCKSVTLIKDASEIKNKLDLVLWPWCLELNKYSWGVHNNYHFLKNHLVSTLCQISAQNNKLIPRHHQLPNHQYHTNIFFLHLCAFQTNHNNVNNISLVCSSPLDSDLLSFVGPSPQSGEDSVGPVIGGYV